MQSNSKISKYVTILQIIKNNETERAYFFRKLSLSSNPSEWLIPLNNEGYFLPKNHPKIKNANENSYDYIKPWDVLQYLLNVSKINNTITNAEITNILIKIVNSIIEYRDEYGNRIDYDRTDWFLFQIIFYFPVDKISIAYIDFVNVALTSKWDNTLITNVIKTQIIPVLVNNNMHNHLKKLMLYFWQYKKSDNKGFSDEYGSHLNDYYIKDIMDSYRLQIAKLLKDKGVEVAEKIIREIINKDKSQFNIVWIPHIREHQQNKFPDRYEIQIIFFLRDCLLKTSIKKLKYKIASYLIDDHPIFRRLAFFLIDHKYDKLNNLLWNIKDNPINYYSVKHELYVLFENHASDFNNENISQIIKWIENIDFTYLDKERELKINKKKIIALKKKEWLFSLRSNNNVDIQKLFKKYNSINPIELDHPGLDFWSGNFEWVDDEEMPQQFEDIYKKSNNEIVKILKGVEVNRDKNNYWKHNISTKSFSNAIKSKPQKFSKNLGPFLQIKVVFQYEIVRSFLEIWRNNVNFDWGNLLEFILSIIEQDIFWKEYYKKEEYNFRNWLVNNIAELIESGTARDTHSFEPELLPKAKKILFILNDNIDSYTEEIELDLVTKMLNSQRGRFYDALINYSLRYARLYNRKKEMKLEKDVKDLFELKLNQSIEVEFFYSIGKYIRNIRWLDNKWFMEKFDNIFPIDNERIWICIISGYLYYSRGLDKEIYIKLLNGGHILKALQFNFEDNQLNKAIIQQICVSYLNKWESSKNNLMAHLIKSENFNQFEEVIQYLWANSDSLIGQKSNNLVIQLFKKIYKKLISLEELEERNKVLSNLNKLIIFVENLDNALYQIFKETIKYSSDHFNSIKVLEGLVRLVEDYPKKVFVLLKTLIEHDVYPYYKEEDLAKILECLKRKNLIEEVKTICNILMRLEFYEYRKYLDKIE